MEASAAAGPAAAAGEGDPSQDGGQPQEQGQPDLAAIQQQLAELGPSLEQMRGMLTEQQEGMYAQQQQLAEAQGWTPEQIAQAEAEAQPQADLSYLNPDAPGYDPNMAAQTLANVMQQASQQQVQQAVAPLQEQIATMEAQRQADLLAAEFPELEDPEIAQNVVNVSRQYAEIIGKPELGDNPAFWRMAYMAGRAADAANAEQQQQPAAATLEGAAGASPGIPADEQQQLVQGILNAGGRGRSVLPFS
jgi:hypothetical protein